MYCSRNINNQWRKIFLLSTCEGSYRVVSCLSVRIQAIETVDSKHSNHAASVCQHILLLSKTHRLLLSRDCPREESDNKHKAASVGKYSEGLPKSL